MTYAEHVLPHGPLTRVAEDVWVIRGTLPRGPLPRNMVVVRHDGGVWLHSPVAVGEDVLAELLAMGPITHIVVPSGLHRLDAAVFAERFPTAQVLAPSFARERVEKLVKVHAHSEDGLKSLGVGFEQPHGTKPAELALRVPSGDGHVLVVCDLLFNIEGRLPGFGGWLVELIGSSGFFGMTRIGRMGMLSSASELASWLRAEADRDGLRAVIPAHGSPVVDDPGGRLRAAADRL
ncbi:MAG: hypothetical protein KC912_02635 [Proteobacteria bacterium]|nr:hypothetical protein [Pseudomonadota bacterium]